MTGGYVHGYADQEHARLISQAEHWCDEVILSRTNLAPGTRLLEVGCGVGAVLRVLGDALRGVCARRTTTGRMKIAATRRRCGRPSLRVGARGGRARGLSGGLAGEGVKVVGDEGPAEPGLRAVVSS